MVGVIILKYMIKMQKLMENKKLKKAYYSYVH